MCYKQTLPMTYISIRFLDVRTKAFAYEWRTTLATGGEINLFLLYAYT
jgi:hypothetical protein